MTNENLTCERYLNDSDLRASIDREARRERAAAVSACFASAITALRRLVYRVPSVASTRPAAQ